MSNTFKLDPSVIVSNQNPIRSYLKEGVNYPAAGILSLVPLTVNDIEKNTHKKFSTGEYINTDLYVHSLSIDLPVDDDEYINESNSYSIQNVKMIFRIAKAGKVERKIGLTVNGHVPGRALVIPKNRDISIYCGFDMNSITFFCRPIHLESEIYIP